MSEYSERLAHSVSQATGWGWGEIELVDPRDCDDVELVKDDSRGVAACYFTGTSESVRKAYDLDQGTPEEPLTLWDACRQAGVKPGAVVCYWHLRDGEPQARRVTFFPGRAALSAAEMREIQASHATLVRGSSGGLLYIDGAQPAPHETPILFNAAAASRDVGLEKVREMTGLFNRLCGGWSEKYVIHVNLFDRDAPRMDYYEIEDEPDN